MLLLPHTKGQLTKTSFQKLTSLLCERVFVVILPIARLKHEGREGLACQRWELLITL